MHSKGIPSLIDQNNEQISQENYQERLYKVAKYNSKFSKVKGMINGKAFLEGIQDDLFIEHEIHHLILTKPKFEKYTKVDETYGKVITFSCPSEQEWDRFLDLIE